MGLIVSVKGWVVAIGEAVNEPGTDWLGDGLRILAVGLIVWLTVARLAEGDGVQVSCEGDGLPLRWGVALYTEEEGDGVTVS